MVFDAGMIVGFTVDLSRLQLKCAPNPIASRALDRILRSSWSPFLFLSLRSLH